MGSSPSEQMELNLQYPGVRIKCVSTDHKVEFHCSISLVTKKNWYVIINGQDSTISVNSVCILDAFPV